MSDSTPHLVGDLEGPDRRQFRRPGLPGVQQGSKDVVERGSRALRELHDVYYDHGLSLLAAWQADHESYAVGNNGAPTSIPIAGWFAQAGYLVTGETIRDRTLIDPIHPFDLRQGHFGLGALKSTARYNPLELDNRAFTAGLADPKLRTNRAEVTDDGFGGSTREKTMTSTPASRWP